MLKAFKSPIVEIASDTFNTGQSKFAAQFTLSRKEISSYIQRSVGKEAYLVAQTIRTGVLQTINLPLLSQRTTQTIMTSPLSK